jgi:hypothetical protein
MSAALRGLVERWRRPMEPPPHGPFDNGLLFAKHKCADELEAALAAEPGLERAVIERAIHAYEKAKWESIHTGDVRVGAWIDAAYEAAYKVTK